MITKSVKKSQDGANASNSESSLDSVLREIYSNVEQSVNHLVGDFEKLKLYKDAQTSLTEKAKIDVPNPSKMNTNEVYAATLGVTEPNEVDIFPLLTLTPKVIDSVPGVNQRVRLLLSYQTSRRGCARRVENTHIMIQGIAPQRRRDDETMTWLTWNNTRVKTWISTIVNRFVIYLCLKTPH